MHERIKSMWPDIIRSLLTNGLSQKALADKVGVNQSTICRLADGEGPEPRWSVGAKLIDLAGGPEALAQQHGLDVAVYLQNGAHPNQPLELVDRRSQAHPIAFEDRRINSSREVS
jgi:DNA-binding XRE family transcriptional regulator